MAAKVRVQRAGWCRLALDDPAVEVKARFAVTATGRLGMAEVVVARFGGVSADGYRAVPFGQLEAWANGPDAERLLPALKERDEMTEDDRRRTDDEERAEAAHRAEWGTSSQAVAGQERMMALARRPPNLRLRVPERQPKPDAFYRRVAKVYSHLTAATPRPAQELAEANGVPVTTVHAWVKEARRRGFLAPGERRKRGTR